MPSKKMTTEKRKDGDAGEDLAGEFLEEKGYEILERNYHSAYGEIDIVCRKGGEYVFVEVKLREKNPLVSGEEAVGRVKLERFVKTVFEYLEDKDLDEDTLWRVDVITVEKGGSKLKIKNHLEDVELD